MTGERTAVEWRREVIPRTEKWPGRVALVAYDEWGDGVVSYHHADFATREAAETYARGEAP